MASQLIAVLASAALLGAGVGASTNAKPVASVRSAAALPVQKFAAANGVWSKVPVASCLAAPKGSKAHHARNNCTGYAMQGSGSGAGGGAGGAGGSSTVLIITGLAGAAAGIGIGVAAHDSNG